MQTTYKKKLTNKLKHISENTKEKTEKRKHQI